MSESGFLAAMRFADSFLPVGTYTASYGLEQYINEGRVETATELGSLVEAYLVRIVGPAETVALANAHGAAEADDPGRIIAADQRLHAATLPTEFRTGSTRAGGNLLELLAETDPAVLGAETPDDAAAAFARSVTAGETPGHYPVVVGVVAQRVGLSRREACLVGMYSFTTELLGAAQRLGRFGHTEVQTQLTELLPVMETLVDEHADADLETLATFAPLAETMGMTHERAERRLFVS